MTRVVLAISFDETIYLLNRLFVHTGYTPKRTAGNQVSRSTVSFQIEISVPFVSDHRGDPRQTSHGIDLQSERLQNSRCQDYGRFSTLQRRWHWIQAEIRRDSWASGPTGHDLVQWWWRVRLFQPFGYIVHTHCWKQQCQSIARGDGYVEWEVKCRDYFPCTVVLDTFSLSLDSNVLYNWFKTAIKWMCSSCDFRLSLIANSRSAPCILQWFIENGL